MLKFHLQKVSRCYRWNSIGAVWISFVYWITTNVHWLTETMKLVIMKDITISNITQAGTN